MKSHNNSEAELKERISDLEMQQVELELQNKKLIREKDEAVQELALRNDTLSKLNRFSIELALLPSEDDLEEFITRRIKEFAGSMAATFSEYNPETRSLTSKYIDIEPGLLEKVVGILGRHVTKIQIPLSDEVIDEMNNELVGMRKTLHEATFGSISRAVGAAIQALLNIDRFIGIAYHTQGKLYGTTLIALKKDQPDPSRETLEDFISMASLALHRKNADAALKASEEMYQTFIDSTEDMAYLKDENLRYVIINKANARFFGKKKEDIIGLTDYELMDNITASSCRESDRMALNEDRIIISEEKVDGRIYETRKFQVKVKTGMPGIGGYIRDITARKAAEEALEESEERYKRITEGLTDYLYTVIVKDGVVTETIHNEACKAVTGYSAKEFLKDPYLWINMVVPEERQLVANRFFKILNGEDFPAIEHRIICKNGIVRWVSDTIIPKYNLNGNLISYDGVIKEITERKKAEEIIKHKNEELILVNAEKDRFFSIIAHDLRSPFNAFLGFTQMMAEELESMSITEIQKIAVSMRNSASNLFQLLENLLEWSLFERGVTSFLPEKILLLPKITESLLSVLESANKKGIEIRFDIPGDMTIMADANMFGSIIRNIVVNAVKFTYRRGYIDISAKRVSGDFAEISVKDTGIGLSKELIDNLFRIDEHNSRAGTDGEPSTGLGLIICREFVEKHGGNIRVKSTEEKGSEFMFTIPLAQ